MDIKLYVLPNRIGLKFTQATERDLFWTSMSDAGRAVSERIGNRTIRFLPQQMKDNQGLIIPLSGNGTAPVAVPVVAKPQPVQAQAQPGIVNLAAGGDPFAPSGNAVKALPGMVAVQSNIAPGMAQEASEAAKTPPSPEKPALDAGNAGTGHPEATEPKPEPARADPEPPDKRTKAYREWWKRNHHGKA